MKKDKENTLVEIFAGSSIEAEIVKTPSSTLSFISFLFTPGTSAWIS